MEASCSVRKVAPLLFAIVALVVVPAPSFAEQPDTQRNAPLQQQEVESGLAYAAKLRSQAAQYNELAASADIYAKQSSNLKDKTDWENTARKHRESAEKLLQQAAAAERTANARSTPTPSPTATNTPTPTATTTASPTATSTSTPTPTTTPTTPPPTAAASTVKATTPTNMPFDFPVESAIGEWFVAGTKEMVIIDQRNPDSDLDRYKLVANTNDGERTWNGTYTSFNSGDIARSQNARLVFHYKPRASEMNADMPSWVCQYLEEKLEWVLELDEAPPPDNPTLVGRWYAGEVKWEDKENGRIEIIGRGKPREVTLERECVFKDPAPPRKHFSLPPVAGLPGPTTKAWSDTALDFLAVFNANDIGEAMLDRFHEAGGHINVIQGKGTSSTDARYNTDDDVIKLGKGAINANGVISKNQPGSTVAVYTHEFMHAYIDQVVQPGFDPTTAQILAQGANWLGQQQLQLAAKQGNVPAGTPMEVGSSVLDTQKKRDDFFEEYTGLVINRMVTKHLEITNHLNINQITEAEAEQTWRCFLSKFSREKITAYEDADSPERRVNAGPPDFLTNYLTDLLGLGYPRPK